MDEMVTRHDLADRCIFLKFPPIPDEKRITEKDLVECFNKVQPLILGALLDAVVTAMDNISSITLEELPRMADFATWIAAAEPALPGERGAFADAYNENRKEIVELSLEVDLLATEVRKLMEDRDRWEGTATELLDALEAGMEDRERNRKGWPKAPNVLSRRLVRLSSFLRRVGIQVDRKDPKGKDRGITIHRLNQKNTVHTVSTVQDQEKCESTADDKMDDTDDSTVQRTRTNLSTVRKNANNINGVDDTDDMDDKNPLLSKPHRDKCNKCKLCEVGQGTFLCNFEDPTPIGDLNFCPLDAS
jgi:hypothetical protein